MTDQVRADEMTAKYIALRDFKAKFKAEFDEKAARITARMDEIEAQMMGFLNATGQESSKTESGTFFKKTSTSSKVADRDTFLAFVLENNAVNFLENRVNNTAVTEYIETHGSLPPGVDVTRVVSVSVNRPAKR
jgi:hypothetical protein